MLLFGNTINVTLFDNLDPAQKAEFMSTAERAAQQGQVWQEMVYRSVLHGALVVEQMLDPTKFESDLNNYPLTWESANAMNWNQIREDSTAKQTVYFDEDLGWEVSKEYVSWVDTVTKTAATENFKNQVQSNVQNWAQMYNEGYGTGQDVFPVWMYFHILEQLDGVCPLVRILYPASDYTGDDVSVTFEDVPDCDEVDPFMLYLRDLPRLVP